MKAAVKTARVKPRGKRLKGLEEFEPPEFVGRMAQIERIERRRRVVWYAMLVGVIVIGSAVGWSIV